MTSNFDVWRQTGTKITILSHIWAILMIFSAHIVISQLGFKMTIPRPSWCPISKFDLWRLNRTPQMRQTNVTYMPFFNFHPNLDSQTMCSFGLQVKCSAHKAKRMHLLDVKMFWPSSWCLLMIIFLLYNLPLRVTLENRWHILMRGKAHLHSCVTRGQIWTSIFAAFRLSDKRVVYEWD